MTHPSDDATIVRDSSALPIVGNTALLSARSPATRPCDRAALFGLGSGWNLSFVAATAVLTDRAKPWERGSLLASDSSRRSS
jgi:hypothetical protein